MTLAPLAALGALVGCSGAPAGAPVGTTSESIVNGTASDSSQDAVVLLFDESDGFACSGTLVAPNLVLTARHCVSNVTSDEVSCNEDGTAAQGGVIGADYTPSNIGVLVGATRPPGDTVTPTTVGSAIFHDDATNLCDHDVALLELATSVSAPVATLRLDAGPVDGESFLVVGWGATTTAALPTQRQQRADVSLLSVGPANYEGLAVPANDFVLGESICDGDSGAPAYSATTGALVGVAADGGNGTPGNGSVSSTCVNAGNGVANTFTAIAPFKSVIEAAFAAVGATPQIDDAVPPAPSSGGCAATARLSSGGPPPLALLAALAIACALRRRKLHVARAPLPPC